MKSAIVIKDEESQIINMPEGEKIPDW